MLYEKGPAVTLNNYLFAALNQEVNPLTAKTALFKGTS